jgi:hypothetical protein
MFLLEHAIKAIENIFRKDTTEIGKDFIFLWWFITFIFLLWGKF